MKQLVTTLVFFMLVLVTACVPAAKNANPDTPVLYFLNPDSPIAAQQARSYWIALIIEAL